MRVTRLLGLLSVIGWFGVSLSAEATAPAVSCSSVFIESLQEYRSTLRPSIDSRDQTSASAELAFLRACLHTGEPLDMGGSPRRQNA
jgi:hypothetical protein